MDNLCISGITVALGTLNSVIVGTIGSPRIVPQGLNVPVIVHEVGVECFGRGALVLSVQFLHLRVSERKVKDTKVFLDPQLLHTLGDNNDTILHLVSEQHLGRGLAVRLGNPHH